MPANGKLPRYLYLRRLVIRAAQVTQLAARALLVGCTWLALLPYININVWRFMFLSIDVATWIGVPGSLDRVVPPVNSSNWDQPSASNSSNTTQSPVRLPASLGRIRNGSAPQTGRIRFPPVSMTSAKAALGSLTKKLAHDCFEGQILSCAIVVFFVGVFLLREWILQNIPQNFDAQPNLNLDGNPPPAEPLANAALPAQPIAQPRPNQDQNGVVVERREEQPEPLLARTQNLEHEETTTEPDQAEAAAQGHELDQDDEVQREQARQARIRKLDQVFGHPPTPTGESVEGQMRLVQPPEDLRSDGSTAVNARSDSVESSPLSRPNTDLDSTMPHNLQDVLGWSEGGPQLQSERSLSDVHLNTDSRHQKTTPSTSRSTVDALGPEHQSGKPVAEQQLEEQQEQQQRGESSSSSSIPDRASSSHAVSPQDSGGEASSGRAPIEASTTMDEDEAADATTLADQDRDADEAAFDETLDGQEDDDAWEDESEAAGPAGRNRLEFVDEAALRAAAAAAFPPPIAHPVADDEIEIAAVEAEDPEAEIGLAEEMDGILEAIGMRGPLFGIVQNLFLMIFLCGFVMLAFVMMPYVVGRTLGSGPGLIRLLALPVKLLRYVTDPVFDFFIALGANSVWPKIAGMVGIRTSQVQDASAIVSDSVSMPAAVGGWSYEYLPSVFRHILSMKTEALTEKAFSAPAVVKSSATATMLARVLPVSVTSSPQWETVCNSFDIALATGLRGTLHRIGEAISLFFDRLDAHRVGTTGTDRAFCVAFGHFYWLLILFIHQHFSKPDLQRALADQSAFKMFMDQHVLIIKAVSFIFIELVVFPLGCGLLFDICTMPFLAEASILLWPEKIRSAPLSFAFTRWMGGTIYMFAFAQYVSATRKVLRPGVLCWIRDPNDPSFHPIREILDKSSWTQLRKIGASAVMYAAILVASVGVNTYFMRYVMGGVGLLPLRWKPFEPLMEVPLDLLLVHFGLPWATQRVDPEKVSEKWLKAWWRAASRMFRLSSYMIGGEFREERRRVRGNAAVAAWKGIWQRRGAEGEEFVEDGGMCRVPADDKAITTGPLIIPLDAAGAALTERLAEAISNQEADAEKHTPKPTYTNVYLPSNYRVRITSVLMLLWLSHCGLFMLGLGVPLVLGRWVSAMLRGGEVHDFYAFSIGLTLLLLGARLVRGSRKMWVKRQRRARLHGTSPWMYIAVQVVVKVKRVGKAIALLVGVGGLVPLVVGLLVHEYVLVSLQYKSTEVPVLHLGQIWACGVLETRLLLFTARWVGIPANTSAYARFMSDVDHVVRGGLYPRPRVAIAWSRIVLPISLAGLVLLLTPALIAVTLTTTGCINLSSRQHEQQLLRHILAIIHSIAFLFISSLLATSRMHRWTQLLMDEVFLESTELKNFPDPLTSLAPETLAATSSSTSTQTAQDAQVAVEAQAAVQAAPVQHVQQADYVAEGLLPDVLLR